MDVDPRRRLDAAADTVLTEPCECGGKIVAVNDWAEIAAAMTAHNKTQLHQAWRRQKERPT